MSRCTRGLKQDDGVHEGKGHFSGPAGCRQMANQYHAAKTWSVNIFHVPDTGRAHSSSENHFLTTVQQRSSLITSFKFSPLSLLGRKPGLGSSGLLSRSFLLYISSALLSLAFTTMLIYLYAQWPQKESYQITHAAHSVQVACVPLRKATLVPW